MSKNLGVLFFVISGLYSTILIAQKAEKLSVTELEFLLEKMTLEEKVGQMAQITLDVITKGKNELESDEPLQLNDSLVRHAIVTYHIGSVLNTANNRARSREKWHEVIGTLQDVAVNKTRLAIPILYGIDAIHGTTYTSGATFFPQQIGMAASRNVTLVERAAAITAYETRASAIPWTFSPVMDLGRDPRFPRMWETFGEDVYLAQRMGVAMINGYEGEENAVNDQYHVASCLKHFLGYTTPRSGKDRTPATISAVELREIHLPPFKSAIDAGAQSIMINSGIINGTPVHADKSILTTLLKDELGFKGLVVTDWADIENLHKRDKVASTMKEAVKLAVNAGIDMSMIPYNFMFCDYLIELVKEGEVSMSRIDDAVMRILVVKNNLGLFSKPVTSIKEYSLFGSLAHEKVAYELAAESITLLKNESNILPLKKNQKVFIAGPNSNSMRTLNGGWSYSWQGEKVEEFAGEYNTILEAIQKKTGYANVTFREGVSYNHQGKYWEENIGNLKNAVSKAKQADVVILALGENSYTEKPGDLHELTLSQNQLMLAKELAKANKPMVLVLNEGRPRIIREIEPLMDAVVQVYLPGNYGADALADVLWGDINPSGKLPYTYPLYSNTLLTYDHKPSENQKKMEGMYDYESDFAVQYTFGHGLSYTSFEYFNLTTSRTSFGPKDTVEISVEVKNTGMVKGKEVVELYVSDEYASITPDNKRLRSFKKIELSPGETKTVSFSLSMSELAFVNTNLNWVVEQGNFTVTIKNLTKKIKVTASKTFTK